MIYFWSDTHFSHAGIITYCRRPFADVAEMNEQLVHRWNSMVGPRDTIWLLGDFGFGGGLAPIFEQLNGIKCLVRGNHDKRNPKVLKLPWDRIEDLAMVKDHGHRLVLCHYPLETWEGAAKGYIMLHGHSHGTLRRVIQHRFDVGVDVLPQGPISLDEVVGMAADQKYQPQDHHGEDL